MCAGRMCLGQADVLALLHLPMQGALAMLPHVPGRLKNRPDNLLLCEMKLSEGVGKMKYSASDVV